jgi:AcrR family transcriptional regulator
MYTPTSATGVASTAAHRSPGPRALQREATRKQLLQAGLHVVAEHGFAGATTAAIAQATGKAHGTVFVHFANRDALVEALVAEIGDAMSQRLAHLPAETCGVAEVIDAHLLALAAHEPIYTRLLREATALPPSARARVFALQSAVGSRLRQAHARDVERGTARAMDPVALANVWIALTNHYLINRDLFAPGHSVMAQRGAELKAQMLAVLQP